MSDGPRFGVLGTILQTPSCGALEVTEGALVTVGADGLIESVFTGEHSRRRDTVAELEQAGRLHRLGSDEYLLPGLVDLHVHAPQWPQLGTALDVPLADWLNSYTFPLEARYRDREFAERVYSSLVAALLANGTTTAVYFGTIHLEATEVLAAQCLERGQRALVGKVAMDNPLTAPDYYRDESAAAALEGTRRFHEYVTTHRANRRRLVIPAVTPRFLPSCTDQLLEELAAFARDTGSPVQTHCSESDWAHGYGLERFGRTDTATFAALGLLGRRTVLAHSNFVGGDDMELIVDAGAAVAHCPLSNAYFANAVFPAREALDRGLHVGLGTDISGGPGASLLRTCADAVTVSRLREDGVDATVPADRRGRPGSRITLPEAFWMATAGGGQALDLPIGLLAPGYAFDAIVITTDRPGSNLAVWREVNDWEDVFAKIVHGATRDDIVTVWVQGDAVVSRLAG
jgi:guanine deaminase